MLVPPRLLAEPPMRPAIADMAARNMRPEARVSCQSRVPFVSSPAPRAAW